MSQSAAAENRQEQGLRSFSLNELATFDGENGAPGYIAIHGKVYDITSVPLFRDGKHHGVLPGNDVTELFVHKPNILNRLAIVGVLE